MIWALLLTSYIVWFIGGATIGNCDDDNDIAIDIVDGLAYIMVSLLSCFW